MDQRGLPGILVVEDNSADVFLIRQALESAGIKGDVRVMTDGEAAVAYFDSLDKSSSPAYPDIVILDINLPKKTGYEVLQHVRASARCRRSLVLAVSTSDTAKDRDRMIQLGADGYFPKPSQYDAFMRLGALVKGLLAGRPKNTS